MSSFYYGNGKQLKSLQQVSQPIGVFAAASYLDKLRRDFPALQIRSFEKLEDMLRAYERNEIAGFFIADLVMQHRVLQTNAIAYQKLEQPRYQTELQVLVAEDAGKLAEQLRQGFQAITQDQLESIEKRWLTRPETGYYNSFRQQVPLSGEVQQWLKEHHVIRVGVMANWPPMEFVDADGQFKGVTQDILTKLNQRLGIELIAVPYTDWRQLVDDFLAKKLDMIANMADTVERRQQADFSLNFWPSQWAVLSLGQSAAISSMRELNGSSVAVEKDYDINLLLEQQFPEIKRVPTSHYNESLELLQQGRVNYAIDTLMVTGGTLRKPEYSNLRMHLPPDMPVTPSLFAVRKDYPLLLQAVNQGLRTLSEADRAEIRNRWFLLDVNPGLAQDRIYTLVLQIVGAGLLLFAVVFFWNMSLRREVGLRREMEQKMRFMATHDDLTQLANRALLQERLEQAVLQHARHQEKLALLFIDLDGFKAVNDNHGHHVGDELLTRVAAMLKHCVRKSDTVARFGGDEFVVLLTGLLDRDDAALVAEKILMQLAQPVQLSVCQAKVGASIGIGMYPDDGTDPQGLLKAADGLMYLAKQHGKGQYRFSRDS
jgi:diguanylate cyclase (GGDEF)-like protein